MSWLLPGTHTPSPLVPGLVICAVVLFLIVASAQKRHHQQIKSAKVTGVLKSKGCSLTFRAGSTGIVPITGIATETLRRVSAGGRDILEGRR